MNNSILGWIRTGVPYAIGAALGWVLVTFGLDLRGEFQVGLVAFLVAMVTNLYYFAVRLIEARFPWVGVFLGFPKAPSYQQVDNLWASFVRTAIPTLVGAVVVSLYALISAQLGNPLDAQQLAGVIAAAVAIVEAAYYALARALLSKWPGLSWLLGTDAPPAYQPGGDVETKTGPRHLA